MNQFRGFSARGRDLKFTLDIVGLKRMDIDWLYRRLKYSSRHIVNGHTSIDFDEDEVGTVRTNPVTRRRICRKKGWAKNRFWGSKPHISIIYVRTSIGFDSWWSVQLPLTDHNVETGVSDNTGNSVFRASRISHFRYRQINCYGSALILRFISDFSKMHRKTIENS